MYNNTQSYFKLTFLFLQFKSDYSANRRPLYIIKYDTYVWYINKGFAATFSRTSLSRRECYKIFFITYLWPTRAKSKNIYTRIAVVCFWRAVWNMTYNKRSNDRVIGNIIITLGVCVKNTIIPKYLVWYFIRMSDVIRLFSFFSSKSSIRRTKLI